MEKNIEEKDKVDIKKEKKKFKKITVFLNRIWKIIVYIFAIIGIISVIWTIAKYYGINIGKKYIKDDPTTRKETKISVVDFGLKDIGKLVTQTSNSTIVFDNKEDRELFNKIWENFVKEL